MKGVNFNKQISATHLSIYRGTKVVVKNLSFEMNLGELVGVLGANGAGKSTLMCALSGECPVASGSLFINGSLLDSLSINNQARVRAVLPQQSMLTFNLSVSEVVKMGAYSYPESDLKQVKEWVEESFYDTDLLQLAQSNYTELSGGQQQRVQLARVLVQARAIAYFQGHAWIFLDEPTACLDPKHQQQLIKKVHELTRTENFGVIVIMHDLNLAALWCDRLMMIKDGALIADGCPIKTLTTKNLFDCFDIPMHVLPHPVCQEKICILTSQ
jgi:iron complex transport system ATP-binding protein